MTKDQYVKLIKSLPIPDCATSEDKKEVKELLSFTLSMYDLPESRIRDELINQLAKRYKQATIAMFGVHTAHTILDK